MFEITIRHKPPTPFPYNKYFGSNYFCDREEETERLTRSLTGGNNTTLFAIRRIGKTGLIHHVFHKLSLEKDWVTIYFDILSTTNLRDFISRFSAAVMAAIPPKTSVGEKMMTFVKSLRPLLSFDPVTGLPEVSLKFSSVQEQENTLRSLLNFLNNQDVKVAIAIDEFQRIEAYPEKNMEALLRTEIQHMHNTSFIFSGSQQHLLIAMFGDASRPFYRSGDFMKLEKLDAKVYRRFLKRKFSNGKRKIDSSDIDYLIDLTKCHTFYTQMLCNRLWLTRNTNIKREDIDLEMYRILQEQEAVFFTYRDLLTGPQWKLLVAIGKEKRVYKPTAQQFILDYRLGTPASVKRSLDALLTKEMVYREREEEGVSYLEVYDLFLSRWIERL